MEEEFIQNQERLKPQEDRNEEERNKVDQIRGSPMMVGTLEEVIDDNHAIVSSSVGPQCYVTIMSFVDKDQIEPGCQVLLHIKVRHERERHEPQSLSTNQNAGADLVVPVLCRTRPTRWSACCRTMSTRW